MEVCHHVGPGRGDLAGAAHFRVAGASDYVHGHLLAVDGGWLSR